MYRKNISGIKYKLGLLFEQKIKGKWKIMGNSKDLQKGYKARIFKSKEPTKRLFIKKKSGGAEKSFNNINK